MKKLISIVLVVIMVLGLAPVGVVKDCDFFCVFSHAQTITSGFCGEITDEDDPGDNATWTLKDATLTIEGTGMASLERIRDTLYDHDNTGGHYIISSLVIGKDINGIYNWLCWDYAYDYWLEDLNSITVKAGNSYLISKGNCLIDKATKTLILGCVNSVIPNDGSVKKLGDGSFAWLNNLTEISIPDSVTVIGNNVFDACERLTSVKLPTHLTKISELAFYKCSGLVFITFPDTLTSIGSAAFEKCTALKEVSIPKNVSSIGSNPFIGCSRIDMLKVAAGNSRYLGAGNCIIDKQNKTLIAGCRGSVIPSDGSVKEIGERAFYDCYRLRGITIPDTVRSIGSEAFYGCSGLEKVSIPDSVNLLGNECFQGCAGLKSARISNSLVTIPFGAFRETGLTNVTIPESVREISDCAFSDCSNLQTISLPQDLIKIGGGAFSNSGLRTISIPDGITYIEGAVFYQCYSLESITIPDSVIEIASDAFDSCDIKEIYFTGTETQWNNIVYPPYAENIYFESSYNGEIDEGDDTVETLSGSVSFSTGDSSGSTTVSFNSGYVAGDSLNYHHDLAQLCSQIVTVGYAKDESTIRNMLQTIGFSSDGNYIKLTEGETESTESHVNNFIAHRDVTISGEEYHVLLVACIGSNRRQWYNNFQPGTGEVHAGFQQAADYMKKQIDGYLKNRNWTKENTKIIFTGHSRGAAVSNLLAADFILNGKYAKSENIYAYTFATPNNTSTKKIAKSAAKCKRIYNFVNPEDFVTYVLLSKWGYGKYGQTLVLPSKSNEYNYSSYKSSMQNYFAVLTEGLVYNPYPNGMDTTTTIINKVFSRVPVITNFDKKQFRTTLLKKVSLQSFFQDYICAILAEKDGGILSKAKAGNAAKNLIVTAFSPTADSLLEDIADYFMLGWETVKDDFSFDFSIIDQIRMYIPGLSISTIKNMKRFLVDPLAGYFNDAHRAETYCAYLLSMTREQAYDQGVVRANRKYCVRCPIDVEIYDNATGNLVGKIVNNVVDETVATQEDAVVMSVEQEEKTFSLPANGDYEIKLLGNDSGTMNVTVESTDYQTGEEERVNYYDIPVSKTSEFHLTQPSEEASVQEVTLTDGKGQEIQIAQTVSSEEYDALTVHVTTEGIGSVSAPSVATAGDYVIMEAETDRNNGFLGWYSKDGKQLGSEPVYSVIAKGNIEIVARFSNNKGKEISGIELDASPKYIVGKADEITAIPLKVTPDGVTLSQLSFTMTDESIADLMASDDGFYLIGKTPGKTVLEIKSEDGKKTFSFYVIVIAPEDTSVIFVPGDVDGNGAVESADARMALRGSVKLDNIEIGTAAFLAADADGNGVLESGDARLILRASVKLEALPLTSAA